MTVLERLQVELNHKDYKTDDEYTMYLSENSLNATDTYDKATMQRNLLITIVDILESILTDTDIMRTITDATTNMTTGECAKLLTNRISDIKDKIATLPDDNEDDNDGGMFKMMFTRGY